MKSRVWFVGMDHCIWKPFASRYSEEALVGADINNRPNLTKRPREIQHVHVVEQNTDEIGVCTLITNCFNS